MLSGWTKSRDIRDRYDSGGDLICYTDYNNKQSNAVISQVSLCGYKDGSLTIFVTPFNTVTELTVTHKIQKATSSLKFHICPSSSVDCDIKNMMELECYLSIISTIDLINTDVQEEIKKDFVWFQSNEELSIKSLSNQEADLESPPLKQHELELYWAIENGNIDKVKKLLTLGVSPNLPPYRDDTPLLTAVYCYMNERRRNKDNAEIYFAIIKVLLDYRADYTAMTSHKRTALSLATEFDCVELVHLLLKYTKEVEFQLPEKKLLNKKIPAMDELEKNFKRISFFDHQLKKSKSLPPTQVRILKPASESRSIVDTEFSQGTRTVMVELLQTKNITTEEFEAIFNLYKANFNSKSEDTDEKKREHLKEKFGFNHPDKNIFCDVIKDGNKIIGFHLYEKFEGVYHGNKYQFIYLSLIYVEPDYRGTRMMTLLSLRPATALQLTFPDEEIYLVYDAIHPNSLRLIYPYLEDTYPFSRTPESLGFVKQLTAQIYGTERASMFDGKNQFYWKTESRVTCDPIDPDKDPLPSITDKFDEITGGKNGVPRNGGVLPICPMTKRNMEIIEEIVDEKLNNNVSLAHIQEFSSIVFHCKEIKETKNNVTCLLSGSLRHRG